jgi:tetratricopeptide (TPR) repeat protein
LTSLSVVQFDESHLPDYVKTSDQSLALLQAQLARTPDDRDTLLAQSAARDLRGQYLSQADDSPAGRQATVTAFQQSAQALERIHALEPDRADITRKLAGSLSNVGSALSYAGDLKGATARLRQAIALLASLAARDPLDMDSRGTQALVTTNLGDLLREIHEYDDAIRNGNDAIAMFGRMADGARLDASMRSAVGVAHYVLAKSLTARANAHPNGPAPAAVDRTEGCRQYNIALGLLEALKASSGIVPGNLSPDDARKEMHDKGCPVRAPAPSASAAA